MVKKTTASVFLAASMFLTAACHKSGPCAEEDPWGLIGDWAGQEWVEEFENGQLTMAYPSAYQFAFRADGTGEKTVFVLDTILPFQWTVNLSSDRLTFLYQRDEPDNLSSWTDRYSLVNAAPERIELVKETSWTQIRMPAGDTVVVLTRRNLVLQPN
jgi:hypothetical protein